MDVSDYDQASDILRSAWKRYAELDAAATKMTNQHRNLKKWVAILGVIATFIAVFLERIADMQPFAGFEIATTALQIILISLPISISVIAAYINKFLGNGEWLYLRAAAEEVLKEIYLYRTILQWHPQRDKWLAHRLTTVLRRVYRSMSGQLVLDGFEGQLPPYFDPNSPYSDPGFSDMTGADYLRYRLIDQRNWHRNRIIKLQRERKRIQLTILAMGGLGALLAAIGGELTALVAITAAVASALNGWEQMRGLDETIMIYSRLILELTVIRDEYESAPLNLRNRGHLVRMVRGAEGVMWAQNQKYVATMQEALAAAEGDDGALVEEMISAGNETMDVIQTRMRTQSIQVMEHTRDRMVETVDVAGAAVEEIVDMAADEAQAYAEFAETSVDKAIAESKGYRDTTDAILDEALTESEAIRESIETAGQAVISDADIVRRTVETTVTEESAAMRETAEAGVARSREEFAAYRDTTDAVLDEALAESEAIRESIETAGQAVISDADIVRRTVETTVTEESAALRETAEAGVARSREELAAYRDTAVSSVEKLAAESAEMRASVEAGVDLTAEEMGAMSETLEKAAGELAEEAAALRASVESASSATADEMAVVRDTLDESAERLLEESAMMRQMMAAATEAGADALHTFSADALDAVVTGAGELEDALLEAQQGAEPKVEVNPEDYLTGLPDPDSLAQSIIDESLKEADSQDTEFQQAIENVFKTGDGPQKSMIEDALSGLIDEDGLADEEEIKG